MTPSKLRTLTVVFGFLALVAGCSTPTNYVVVNEEGESPEVAPAQPPLRNTAERYTVKPGDSLYLISFATGTDWQEIARLNGINPPYRIYPGQSLLVRPGTGLATPPPRSVANGSMARPAPQPSPVGPSVLPLPSPAPGVAATSPRAAVSGSQVRSATPAAPLVSARTPAPAPSAAVPPSVAAAPSITPPRPPAAAPSAMRPPKPGVWQWPASGKLIGRFSGGAQPHKGVDLDGRSGDPVRAANSGVVVYAGSGVRGYGNLLIVKHDDVYLSAYAHNSKLLVKEGDVVKAGQTIAQIGDSGTDRVKLHFEVRRKGTPVDPLKVLPRR